MKMKNYMCSLLWWTVWAVPVVTIISKNYWWLSRLILLTPPLKPFSRWNFWLSWRHACISPHAPTTLRSQNKAPGPASRSQRLCYPKSTLTLFPKSLAFSKPPCSPAPHHKMPPMAPHTHSQPHTPLWWEARVRGEPGCITWSPQYVMTGLGLSKTSLRPSRGVAVMMLRGQKHIQGADFIFSAFHKGLLHAREGFTPWEIISHNPNGPVSLGSYTHTLKYSCSITLELASFTQEDPLESSFLFVWS